MKIKGWRVERSFQKSFKTGFFIIESGELPQRQPIIPYYDNR